MTLKDKARQLKQELPVVWLALRHRDTPLCAKLLAAVTVGYALSPIDVVPDFIPVLGYLDDVILLPLLILCTRQLIPEPVLEECRREAEGMWQDGRPKKWYYAVPVVLLWALVLWLILKGFLT